jgi:PAS domain S-box-containing protein
VFFITSSRISSLAFQKNIMPKQPRSPNNHLATKVPGLDERTWLALFAVLPLPMWICDASSLQILHTNDAAISYGFGRDELSSIHFTDLLTSAGAAALHDALRNKQTRDIDLELINPNGSSLSTKISISDVDDVACNLIVFVAYEVVETTYIEPSMGKQADELRERVKELTCLFHLSQLLSEPDLTIPDMLQRAAELLPQAWQYPEISGARLSANGQQFSTAGFRETPWMQRSPLMLGGEEIGCAEICYLQDMPPADEGPFLKEERALLDEVVGHIARFIERKQIETELEENARRFGLLIDHLPVIVGAFDEQMNLIVFNQEAERVTGYKAEELIDNPDMLNLMYPNPDYREQIINTIYQDNVSVQNWELNLTCKNGEIKTIAWSSGNVECPIPGWGLWGIGIDVTARKAIEAAEREQRRLAEALQDTAAALNSTLDFEELLDLILANVERVVPHEAACIMLLDNAVVRVVRNQGYERWGLDEIMRKFEIPLEKTTALRQMKDTGLPVSVALIEDLDPVSEYPEFKRVGSYVGAPIIIEGETIGFINLASGTPRYFHERDATRLAAFAHQVATAVRNVRLHNEAQEHNRRLAALNQLTRIGSETVDLDLMLKRLVDEAAQVICGDYCYISLWDSTAQKVIPAAASGDFHEIYRRLEFPPGEQTMTASVLRIGRPITAHMDWPTPYISRDVQAAIRSKLPAKSMLALPLHTTGQEEIGALLIGFAGEHEFSADETEWALQAAELIALAIARAQTHAHLEQLVEERTERLRLTNGLLERQILERRQAELAEREQRTLAEALRDTAAILNSTLDLDEVLDQILENVGRVVPHQGANIMLVEHGTASLARSRGYAERGAKEALLSVYFPANSMFEIRSLIKAGEPTVIPDTQHNQDWVHVPESKWIRSYLGCPIRMDGEVIGFLNLDSSKPGFFNLHHTERLQAFADQAAVAIKNARLYEQAKKLAVLEERQRLSRDLHDAVSQTLWSASLIADVLPTLWEQDEDEGRRNLQDLKDLTRAARDEMRGLLLELRPGALTQTALPDLLNEVIRAANKQTSARITLKIHGKDEIPAKVQIAFYRIAQEALNNIVKHSKATEAVVELDFRMDCITLIIRDNGRGFDPEQARAGHLGTGIIQERALSIGALARINSHIGEGTEVCVEWVKNPYTEQP